MTDNDAKQDATLADVIKILLSLHMRVGKIEEAVRHKPLGVFMGATPGGSDEPETV